MSLPLLHLPHRPNRSGLQPQHGELGAAQPAGAAAVSIPADGGANHLPHLHRQPHQTGLPVRTRLLHRVQRRAQDLPHLPADHPRADSAVRMKTSRPKDDAALAGLTTESPCYMFKFIDCSLFSCSSLEQNKETGGLQLSPPPCRLSSLCCFQWMSVTHILSSLHCLQGCAVVSPPACLTKADLFIMRVCLSIYPIRLVCKGKHTIYA